MRPSTTQAEPWLGRGTSSSKQRIAESMTVRLVSVWGLSGVKMKASRSLRTIGPPAERL